MHLRLVVSAWLALCIQRNGGNLDEVDRLVQQAADSLEVLTEASKGFGMIDAYCCCMISNLITAD